MKRNAGFHLLQLHTTAGPRTKRNGGLGPPFLLGKGKALTGGPSCSGLR
jgi:hypothetical protein